MPSTRLTAAALTLVAAGAPALAAAQTQPPAVVVNGTPVAFDQPPIERAGRVYVPLRGVFERLGASVVYGNGRINATRGAETVALSIGSTTAYVSGRPQTLDSPPFLVAGRTLVPLRFVAQAFGATVAFDDRTRTVAVTQALRGGYGGPRYGDVRPPVVAPPPPQLATAEPLVVDERLLRRRPSDGGTESALRPQIAVSFATPVQPDTVRLTVDGRDLTAEAYVSEHGVSYDPSFDLPPGTHVVGVAGTTAQNSQRFHSDWRFQTVAGQPQANFLRNVHPANGATVGGGVTVSGDTQPGARVHIVATTNVRQEGFDETQDAVVVDTVAEADGFFTGRIAGLDRDSTLVDVQIRSTSTGGDVATRILHLRP